MRKNKGIYLLLVVLVIFGISVGYAAISKTLNINGNSIVKQNTWDLHFENVKVTDGSVDAIKVPTLDNVNLSIDFSFNLNLPGDFYEFTVDIVNAGTIDAMIESITKSPELSETQKKYLCCSIEYENGETIAMKQLVKSKEFTRIKVRVEYKSDIAENDLPTIFETLNLGFTINYIQADDSATSVTNNGIIVFKTSGDINQVGTIVTIGSEQFYVIGSSGNNVKLLAMYNLYVGGSFDYSTEVYTKYSEEITGMQDSNMIGYNDRAKFEGVLPFSNDEFKGENYSDYNGSLVEVYVNNYKNLVENKFDVNIIEARLITASELIKEPFNCSVEQRSCTDTEYHWIYSTSYWTSTAKDDSSNSIYYIENSGDDGSGGYFATCYYHANMWHGVRPVIVISKDYFKNIS